MLASVLACLLLLSFAGAASAACLVDNTQGGADNPSNRLQTITFGSGTQQLLSAANASATEDYLSGQCGFTNSPVAMALNIDVGGTGIAVTSVTINGVTLTRASNIISVDPGSTYVSSISIPVGGIAGVTATTASGTVTGTLYFTSGTGTGALARKGAVTINITAPTPTAPTVAAVAGASTLTVGQTTSFTQTFSNPNSYAIIVSNTTNGASGLAFSATGSGTCTGGTGVSVGSGNFSANVSVPANGDCTVVGTLSATAAGSKTITPGAPTGTLGANSATGIAGSGVGVTVNDPVPTIGTISPAFGQISTTPASVTITGTNFNATFGNNSVTFGGVAGTVTAGNTTSLTVTPPTRGTTGAVDVVVTNTANSLSATSTGGYTYVAPPTIAAAFGASTISTSGSASLTLTITNPAGNSASLTGFSIATASLNGLSVSQASNGCGATSTIGSGNFSYGGGSPATLAAGASCTIVLTASSSTPGSYSFTTGAISATVAGSSPTVTVAGSTATTPASLAIYAPPTISAAFSPASVVTGVDSELTVTFTNPAGNPGAINGLTMPSSAAAGLTVSNANTGSCAGTATAGSGSIAISAGTTSLAAGSNCTWTFNASSTSANTYNFTPGAPSATSPIALTGAAGSQTSLTVTGPPPTLGVTMTHSGNPVRERTHSYTITPSATVSDTSGTLTATWSLPGGMTYNAASGTGWTCGATSCTSTTPITAGSNGNPISLTLNIGALVSNSVTPSVSLSGGGAASPANASDPTTVWSQGPSASVSVGTSPIFTGAQSLVTVTLTNPNSQLGLLGVANTISLPSNLVVGSTAGANNCGGSLSATAGSGTVTLSGGAFASGGGSCTYSFNVTSNTATTYSVPTGTPTASDAATGTAGSSAGLTVNGAPVLGLAMANSNSEWTQGTATANVRATVSNSGGSATSGNISFTSTLPTGITYRSFVSGTNWSCAGSSGSTLSCTYSGSIATSGSSNLFFDLDVGLNTPNPVTVDFSASGGGATSPATASLTRSVNQVAASATINSGDNQTTTINTSFAPLSVTFYDAGNAVITRTPSPVTFTAPASGASGTLPNGTATQDRSPAQATAGVPFTANGITGSYQVTASMPGASGNITATFNLTNAPPQPSLTINDVTLNETNSGTTNFTFTVNLSSPAGAGGVTFDIATADGTATQPGDYTAQTLTGQTIAAGQSSATFTVQVNGDTTIESNETFFVNVTNVTGATASDGQGQGTITNDDAAPTLTGYTRGSVVAYNPSTTTPTPFDTTFNGVSGSPTSFTVSNASGGTYGASSSTSGGGTVSIDSSGQALFSPAVGYRGNDTFYVIAANASGSSSPAMYSYTVGDPTITATVSGTGAAQNQPLSGYSITFDGGRSPYSNCSSANAPAGLTVQSNCTLTGTPNNAGAQAFNVTVTDSSITGVGGGTASPFTATNLATSIAVAAPPTIATISPSTGLVSGGQNVTITGTNLTGASVSFGGSAGTGVSVNGGGTSLTVNTPTHAAGVVNVAVTTVGGTATQTNGYTYVGALTTTQAVPSVTGTFNTALTPVTPVTSAGGATPVTYALSGATVPSWLSFNTSTGQITGTPDAPLAATTFTVTATDSLPGTAQTSSKTFTLTVNKADQTINFAALIDAQISASPLALSATATSTLTVAFASSTTSVCTVSGTTLNLIALGTCTITASQAGNANWNAAAPDVTHSFQVTPATLTITPGAATGTQVGAAYTQTNVASGGVAPYTYSLSAGTAPSGTTIDAGTGTVSGTPTAAGSFNYIVRATDSRGGAFFVDTPVTGTIAKGNQTISFTSTPPSGANARVGAAPYAVTATASSGLTVARTLDPSSTGCSLSGGTVTFTATGTCVINADQAGDSNWNPATLVQQTIVIGAATAVSSSIGFAPSSLGVGDSGTLTVTLTNGNASNTPAFNVQINAPNIVSLQSATPGGTCTVGSATPSGSSIQLASVVVPGAGNCTVTFNYSGATAGSTSGFTLGAFTPSGYPSTAAASGNSFTVIPTVGSVSPNSGPVSQVVTVTGTGFSTTPGNNTVTFGAAGNGTVTAASSTSLTVTAPAAGTGTVNVTVTVNGQTSAAGQTFTFIAAPTIGTVSPNTGLSAGGTAVTITGTNLSGATSVTFGGSAGTGISVAGGGTSLTVNTPSGTVDAVDVVVTTPGGSATSTNAFTYIAAPALNPVTVAMVGYNSTGNSIPAATVTGATNSPTAWAVSKTSGGTFSSTAASTNSTATNVSINSSGQVTYAAPTSYRGDDSFFVRATNAAGDSNVVAITVPVNNPTLITSLAGSGTRGAVLAGVQVNTSGGAAPYSCSTTLASGALPAGTQLNSNCTITGTPDASGTFNFIASVTDSSTGTGPFTQSSVTLSLVIAAPTVTLSPAAGALPGATNGRSYSQSLSASGGTAPYNFAHTAGALPPGLSLSGTGTISGSPLANGTFNFTVTVTDGSTAGSGGPYTASAVYSITVIAAPAAPTISSPASGATVNTATPNYFGFAPANATVSVSVDGTPVGTTTANPGGAWSVTQPTPLGQGSHSLSATATVGGVASDPSATRNFSVDSLAPATPVISTPANGAVTSDNTPTATGTAEPGVTVTVTFGGTSGGGTVPVTADGGGNWTATSPMVGDGLIEIRATASDSAGNVSPTTSINVRVDTNAPSSPQLIAPSGIRSTTTPTFTGNYGGGDFASVTVTIRVDGASIGTTTVPAGGNFSFTPSAPIAEGAHTATAIATDSAGNVSAPSNPALNFTIDTLAPAAPAIVTPANGFRTNDDRPTFTGTGENGTNVTLFIDGAAASTAVTVGGGTWSVRPGLSRVDGTYTATAFATDTAGNVSPVSNSRTFTIDRLPPSAPVITAPANGATIATATSTITGTVEAGATVTIAIDGVVAGTATVTGTSWTFTTAALSQGAHIVSATAIDTAGNLSPSANRDFTVDDVAPAAPVITTPTPNQAFPNNTPTLSGTAEAGTTVTVTIDGAVAGTATATAGGTWSFTTSALAPGGHSVQATATDAAGNVSPASGSVSFSVTPAPVAADKPGVMVPYGSTGTAIDLSASITGTYTGIAIATAPAHGTVSVAGSVVTYTPTAGYFGADSFTYTATGPGGTSAPATVSLTVAAPPAPVAADKPGVAIPYASTGTAIDLSGSITGVRTSIALGTAPAHGTVTVAGEVVTYTPAANYFGADSFTYTATGPGGTSAPATVGLQVAVPPAPAVADKPGVAVPYNGSGVAIDLSGSITGIRTGIAVATAPAHGAVTVAGEVVTYVPAAGYFGTDSFTFTATGPGGTSAPATVTLQVAVPPAPTVANRTGVAVPYNSTGVAIDLTSSITGVHTSIAVTTAPAHGTTTIAGNVVTYVPAAGYFGADSFAYTASGPGGTSAPAIVSLTVATPPAPVVADKPNVQVIYNSRGTVIDLTASVSGVFTSMAIATQPAHGTVTLSGNVATYVPTDGYYGNDSFTVTATGPGGTSPAATVGLVVATPPPPTSLPGSTSVGNSTTANSSVDIDLSALTSGVYTEIRITGQPANGTVTLSNGGIVSAASDTFGLRSMAARSIIATYTPRRGFVGTDSFQFVSVGPGGTSAPAMVTITVNGVAPIATPKTAQTGDGQTVSVELTNGASEGPFTGANIVSVTPANAATTTIVDSGSGASRTFRLDVTPNARYSGQVVVSYRLANQYGPSNVSTVTVTVTARPDPSADATVRGMADAQAETARRFARTQIDNFMRRNEQLHGGGGSAAPSMGLRLNSRDPSYGQMRPFLTPEETAIALTDRHYDGGNAADAAYSEFRATGSVEGLRRVRRETAEAAEARVYEGTGRGATGTGLNRSGLAVSAGRGAANVPGGVTGDALAANDDGSEGDGTRRIGQPAIWSAGGVDISTLDATTDRTKIRATTSGLSAGMDFKLAEGLIIGLGGGYGNETTRVGKGEGHIRAKNSIVAGYASLTPAEDAFIDGTFGYGTISYRLRRTVTGQNLLATGSREGDMLFGALSTGIDRSGDIIRWSAYARGEFMQANLDSYAETGAGRYNLRFDERTVRSLSSVLGGRFEFAGKTGFGTITPRVRAEWRHEFADVNTQWLDYADIPGVSAYRIDTQGWNRNQIEFSLGAKADLPKDWALDAELGLSIARGERMATLKIGISKEF